MKATAIQSDWVGRVIGGRFTLLQWLGGSGRSGVFLTELPGASPQKAAIKLIADDGDADERIAAFGLSAGLSHPHLVRLFDSGTTEIDGTRFVYAVTEYAEEILAEILPVRALSVDEVKEMLFPVLEALAYLHGQSLVHGHLKPSNILVVNDQLKLSIDCVRPAGASVHVMDALTIYDAPERAAGSLIPASDLWSIGVLLVEAFTQQAPDWNRAANRNPVVPEALPQTFKKIAESCLRINPEDRVTINDIKRRIGLTVVQPDGPRVTPIKREISRKPRPGVLAVVMLVLVVVVALFWSRSHGTRTATRSSDEPSIQSSPPKPAAAEPQLQPTPAQSTIAQEQKPAMQPTPEPVQQPPAAPSSAAAPARTQSGPGEVKGSVAQRVMPHVLESASRTIQGKVNVRVRLSVSSSGEVTDATFESAGPSRYFARVALEAARQWKFTPAQAKGQPIASVWMLHFVFTRGNTDVTPVQTVP